MTGNLKNNYLPGFFSDILPMRTIPVKSYETENKHIDFIKKKMRVIFAAPIDLP